MIDMKLSFFKYIWQSMDKAATDVTSFNRTMSNIRGPKSRKYHLLMTAVQSVFFYGAEVCADALDKKIYRMDLSQV